jgi:hypothetical protein
MLIDVKTTEEWSSGDNLTESQTTLAAGNAEEARET